MITRVTSTRRTLAAIGAAVLVLVSAAAMSACGEDGGDEIGVTHPGPPTEPPVADLSTPESAVRSYLDWTTFAYRTADSAVATHTMSPWEEVRVDSYIELNRQNDRAIEQTLAVFDVGDVSGDEPTVTVTAYEEWEYRYISMSTGYYSSDPLFASYDTIYTVVKSDGLWRVESVEAEPLGAVE